MKKIIFGFVGHIACGKDTCTNYLKEKYSSTTYSFSTMLIDSLNRFYLKINRDNLIKMSEAIREKFGENTMAKTIAQDVEKDNGHMIGIPNIRRMADIEFLSKNSGFVLVKIQAESKTRYKRLIKRTEKADDGTKTYEQFLEDQKRSTEVSIDEVAGHATETIDNNGSLEYLYKQLDALVKKYEN